MHYIKETPSCSTFRVITANFWTSEIFGFLLYSPETAPIAYHKNPKFSDTQNFAVITLKVEQDGFSLEGIANSVDPDHTAQTCLSENLGKLRYLYLLQSSTNTGIYTPGERA